MAQSSEIKLLKRFDQNVEITGALSSDKLTISHNSGASQGQVMIIENTGDYGSAQDLVIKNAYDRDVGIKFVTGGGEYYQWLDSNGDDAMIFSAAGYTRASDATLVLAQNHDVAIPNGDLTVSGILSGSQVRVTNIVTNKIVKFDGTKLDDSIITDNGTAVTVAGNFNITLNNVGVTTNYGTASIEATDAQLDIISSSAGTWGSAINLVEGTSSTANTNIWSIARQTSGVGNLLSFNFGTGNQHDNTAMMSLSTGGNLTLTGTLSASGYNKSNWDTAYSWGDHTSQNYADTTDVNEAIAQSLGWVPAYSNTDTSSIRWNETEQAIELQSNSDSTTGAAYKAIRMKSGDRVRVTVMVRSTVTTTDGLYLRLYFHNGDMPDGKTHVSNSASSSTAWVQEDDSGNSPGWWENNAVTTSWQNFEYTYTAPADGYLSLVVLNWSGIGTNPLYVKNPDIQFEKVNEATTANSITNGTLSSGLSVEGDLKALGQIRATGWDGSNSSSASGHALEIGVSPSTSSEAYLLSYNRNTSSYGDMNFAAVNFNFDERGGTTTIENNEIWHAGNDGPGSGLNADLLDGYHASSFLTSLPSHSHNYIETVSTLNSNYNFNDLYANDQLRFHSTYASNGNWTTATVTNYPSTPTASSAYAYGSTLSLKNNGQGMYQVYAPHNHNSTSEMFFRTGWNADYKPWARVWTDRNHGSGKGLDADLVDGLHASQFLRSDTSDTMSGTLTLNGYAYINPSSTVALLLGRVSGTPTIQANTDDGGHLMMDSNGGVVGLNWYNTNNVVLAQGGGSVGIGSSTVSHKLDVHGNIGLSEYLYHRDDTNTYLRLRADDLQLVAGGRNVLRMTETTDPDKIQLGDSATYTYTDGVLTVGHAAPSGGDYTTVVPKLHVRGADTSGTYTTVARFQAGNDSNDTGAAVLINHSNDRGLAIRAGRKDSDRPVAYFDLIDSNGSATNMFTIGEYGSDFRAGINTTSPDTTFHVNGGAKIGGSFTGTELLIEASDTAGAPAATATIKMIGYEGRGIGTFYKDITYGSPEWFAGLRYSGNFQHYQIGYTATGGQAEYATNAIMTLKHTGQVGIGTSSPIAKLSVANDILVGAQGGSDTTTITGGSGYGSRITLNYADGVANIDLRGNNNSYLNANYGSVGIGTTSPSAKLDVNGDTYISGDLTVNGNQIFLDNVQSRTKLMVWSGSTYGIGMQSGYTYGHIGNDYVMSFQMSDTNNRGFWWGDTGHSNAQGAMSLTTQGKLTVATSLNVGYGESVTSPPTTYALDVTGTIRATADIIAYSDARIKENVHTIDNAIDKVTKLRGVSYNKIGETEQKIGVIAQEIEKVLPQVVSEDDNGMKSVAYGNIVGLLIEAIKEQQEQIEELKKLINP